MRRKYNVINEHLQFYFNLTSVCIMNDQKIEIIHESYYY